MVLNKMQKIKLSTFLDMQMDICDRLDPQLCELFVECLCGHNRDHIQETFKRVCNDHEQINLISDLREHIFDPEYPQNRSTSQEQCEQEQGQAFYLLKDFEIKVKLEDYQSKQNIRSIGPPRIPPEIKQKIDKAYWPPIGLEKSFPIPDTQSVIHEKSLDVLNPKFYISFKQDVLCKEYTGKLSLSSDNDPLNIDSWVSKREVIEETISHFKGILFQRKLSFSFKHDSLKYTNDYQHDYILKNQHINEYKSIIKSLRKSNDELLEDNRLKEGKITELELENDEFRNSKTSFDYKINCWSMEMGNLKAEKDIFEVKVKDLTTRNILLVNQKSISNDKYKSELDSKQKNYIKMLKSENKILIEKKIKMEEDQNKLLKEHSINTSESYPSSGKNEEKKDILSKDECISEDNDFVVLDQSEKQSQNNGINGQCKLSKRKRNIQLKSIQIGSLDSIEQGILNEKIRLGSDNHSRKLRKIVADKIMQDDIQTDNNQVFSNNILNDTQNNKHSVIELD